jgi:hypothetical protein
MPVIEVKFPTGLLRETESSAKYDNTDVNTFILLAVAEKIGALKQIIFDRALQNEKDNFESLGQKYPTIKKVIPQGDFILHFEFESGLEGTFDMKPLIQREGVFNVLTDPEVFKTLKVSDNGDYIQWVEPRTNEEISIGADTLYAQVWRTDR